MGLFAASPNGDLQRAALRSKERFATSRYGTAESPVLVLRSPNARYGSMERYNLAIGPPNGSPDLRPFRQLESREERRPRNGEAVHFGRSGFVSICYSRGNKNSRFRRSELCLSDQKRGRLFVYINRVGLCAVVVSIGDVISKIAKPLRAIG